MQHLKLVESIDQPRSRFCNLCLLLLGISGSGGDTREKHTTNTDENYNPWPGYRFTGPLRAYPVTPKRALPDTIPRPDYAENAEGRPISELAVRGTSVVKVLNDEEIEAMRVACKVF